MLSPDGATLHWAHPVIKEHETRVYFKYLNSSFDIMYNPGFLFLKYVQWYSHLPLIMLLMDISIFLWLLILVENKTFLK